MTFNAQTYYDAAVLHLASVQSLLDKEEYLWAHYAAGISLECMIRAYGMEASDEFTGRHDLLNLAKRSAFLSLSNEAKYDDYRSYLVETNQRWHSSQRFMGEP